MSCFGEVGWDVVYDIIDDWSDLFFGGDWYDLSLERYFIGIVNVVVVLVFDLVGRAVEYG